MTASSITSKAMKQCTWSAKDRFDGWRRATSPNKSASSNACSDLPTDRHGQATTCFTPWRAYLQQSRSTTAPAGFHCRLGGPSQPNSNVPVEGSDLDDAREEVADQCSG